MTSFQSRAVAHWLQHHTVSVAIHGDCLGADEEWHRLVRQHAPAARIEVYNVPGPWNAGCSADVAHRRRDYLRRNREMVDRADWVIATPLTAREIQRSGTWSTVRYAIRKKKRITLYPPRVELPKGAKMEQGIDRAANPFSGLCIGRIVHVCYRTCGGDGAVVERPAIVTEVKDKDRGIISACVFKSPDDPPGEVFKVESSGRMARPLGSEIRYCPPKTPHRPWTWHWPEPVA